MMFEMKANPSPGQERAMTRVEVLAVLGALFLLTLTVGPALGGSAARANRISCLNNLRQIGRAFQMWATDHDGENPSRVPRANGGVLGHPLSAVLWYQFGFLSNQLGSPKILVCPSDSKKKMADNWGLSASGGFFNVAYRDNAASYALGLHTSATLGQSLLAGDRNLRFSGKSSCDAAGINDALYLARGDANVGWTNAIHGLTGNLLRNDGQVLQASTADLQNALNVPNVNAESVSFHLLCPMGN
jgi:hypothetical protein